MMTSQEAYRYIDETVEYYAELFINLSTQDPLSEYYDMLSDKLIHYQIELKMSNRNDIEKEEIDLMVEYIKAGLI